MARVHVVVEALEDGHLPMGVIAQAGGAFVFLADEPDLYTDAAMIEDYLTDVQDARGS